ncbi:unannotated protein [freshwater metagenome]|uniref:Unannotated protein n=1 Tax=freshwater metagenome TaxID=449393 RepID=A0A6J7DRY9_9ZZZZ|nr:ABC transporter substrate-binding protein [Actinomycetota bacterium]
MDITTRVVSLVPSITETLLAWGIVPIACTRFCEQPLIVHVGGTKDPDVERITAMRPTVVLMDREENRRDDAEALRSGGVEVFDTHVTSIDDVGPVLAGLRRCLGLDPLSADGDAAALAPAPAQSLLPRSAFVAIWRRPWMTLNHATYGSSLLASIGITNVFADDPQAYPVVELGQVAALQPDVILLPSEPYAFGQRHVSEVRDAVPGADVRLVDGRDLFWWGVRTPGARRRLAQAIASPGE